MAAGTLKVSGLREVERDFRKLDKGLAGEVRAIGRKAAEPVRAESRALIGRYPGARTQQIGIKSTAGATFVTQRARKVTGKRGDFGRLQQRRMEEALEARTDDVRRLYEDGLDRFTTSAGF